MTMKKSISLFGLARAATPIYHGEPLAKDEIKADSGSIMRRVNIATNTGDILCLPVVAGTAIRGRTRRLFMQNTLRIIGADMSNLEPDIIYWILAGGATVKEDKKFCKNPEYIKEIETKLPFMKLFGGVLKGVFFHGSLRVDFMVPIVKETCSLYPELRYYDLHENNFVSASEFISTVSGSPMRFTRRDNGVFVRKDSDKDGKTIYSAEYIPINTYMAYGVAIDYSCEPVVDAFWAFLDCFMDNREVGGWRGKGFGSVCVEYRDKAGNVITREMIKENSKKYWDYIEKEKFNIREFLTKDLTEAIKGKKDKEDEKDKKDKNPNVPGDS